MLGHASAAMTLDVHADLFDSDLDAVADRLELARQMADETGGASTTLSCSACELTHLTTRMPGTRIFGRPSSWPKRKVLLFTNYGLLQTISN